MDVEIVTLDTPRITDFAQERNKLLARVKKEWVLFLDRDERLNPALRNGQPAISKEFSGYRIRRDNYFLKRFIGSDWIVRLGKRNSGKWVRRVHETWNIKGKVGKLKGAVIVHDTAKSLRNYVKKINFYSTLHSEANKDEGKTANAFKIVFYPLGKFIVTFIKSRHPVFSIMQAFHSFLSWSKLYFLHS